METILSPSSAYKAVIQLDTEKHEGKTRRFVKIFGENDILIHEYQQLYSTSPVNRFITLGNDEWWFGGRNYMLHLFVNCKTGKVFDDPDKRQESEYYESGSEFIWCDIKASPSGHFLFIVGCMWSFPYEYRLYDIRNLLCENTEDISPGDFIREIDLLNDLDDCFVIKEFPPGDPRNDIDDCLHDDEIFTYEFVSDTEVTIRYVGPNGEMLYYNTLDLQKLSRNVSI
jgi:hypothetical protein